MRDNREGIRGCIQCEETNATGIPGDDLVSSLEKCADVVSELCNEPDPRAAGPTYDGKLGQGEIERSIYSPGLEKSVPTFWGAVAAYFATAKRALPACGS